METLRLVIIDRQDSCLIHLESSLLADADPVSLDGTIVQEFVGHGRKLGDGHIQDVENAKTIGLALFSSIFVGQFRDRYVEALALARERRAVLKIQPVFDPGSQVSEFPWEILHDGYRFLACNSATSVVRGLRLPVSARPARLEPPIRILMTTANPHGGHPLKLELEEQSLRRALAKLGDRVYLQVRHKASKELIIDSFQGARAEGRPINIWHHAGHGTASRSEGFLLVLERSGQPELVGVESLGQLIGAGDDLRLAVLNVCYSGATSGLASYLSHWNLPCVVSFRGSIADPSALIFSRTFYPALFEGPVDRAVTLARQAMAVSRELSMEWALPVVQARHSDLQLIVPDTAPSSSQHRPGEDRPRKRSRTPSITFSGEGTKAKTVRQVGGVGERQSEGVEVQFGERNLRADELEQIGWMDGEAYGSRGHGEESRGKRSSHCRQSDEGSDS